MANAANGTVTLNGDGTVTFQPAANFNGASGAGFDYVVTDGAADSSSVSAVVPVNAVNDAPVATGETLAATDEDTAKTFAAADLTGNDTDVDSAALTIKSVANAANGTVTLNGDGTVTFQPAANFNGASGAGFDYVVTDGAADSSSVRAVVPVNAVNDAPVATGETLAATDEDTAKTFAAADLTGNDTDVDSAALTIKSVANAANGTVTLNGDGTVTFQPAANFNGASGAGFDYVVTDGAADSSSVSAVVPVNAVNDAPVATGETLAATDEDTARPSRRPT